MSQAYSSGLKRKETYVLRKFRRLPIPGEILVSTADPVSSTTVVARTFLPGSFKIIDAAKILDLPKPIVEDTVSLDVGGSFGGSASPKEKGFEIEKYMLKKVGDAVEAGEVIAIHKMLFGLVKNVCKSQIKGSIERVSDISGQIVVRGPPIPVEVDAYIPGTVVEVVPKEGVVIEAVGAYVQGIFGLGPETSGELEVIANSPDDVLTPEKITAEHAGKILVGGSMITKEGLSTAVKVGVKGIICGGINSNDVRDFLGYEIGVAITGEEDIGLTLIITEGFGNMRMAERTFNLLRKHNGMFACINGTTQIRAGVIRPEIFIPRKDVTASSETEKAGGVSQDLTPGAPIRIIGGSYFGSLAHIANLPVELCNLETESNAKVLEAKLLDGRQVIIPRANVELIEE